MSFPFGGMPEAGAKSVLIVAEKLIDVKKKVEDVSV